ncbi:MAG: starch-binding protein [Muribaculaceae bacterium]|nr:starch-binding protein [Muribaculaceae bacterium]
MKKLNILGLFLLMLTFFTGCKEESIVLTSELPQFETREGLMLLEVIVPYGTGINDQIYIYGDFNGGEEAIGNPEWLLQRGNPQSGVPAKFGIYLNPSSFVNGKTLADGYTFYNVQSGPEKNIDNETMLHYQYPSLGQRQNVFVDYWEADFSTPENPDDVEHDGYAIYIKNNSSWTDLHLWAWEADGTNLLGEGAEWPGMAATGTMNIGGTMYTYFDTGASNAGKTYTIIISNNGSPQTPDAGPITLDKDYYYELTADGVLVEMDPDASVSHDGYAIFIYNNNPDFAELYAWVWEEGSGGEDFLGVGWPGVPFTGTQMINGVAYEYFDFGAQNDGKTVNFIVNNNNQGKQAEVDGLVLDKNYYYELSGTTLKEIDPETFQPGGVTPDTPTEPDEPTPTAKYNIYIQNETGWSGFNLYAWGTNLPELFGGWPGQASTESATIDGVTYIVYTVEGAGEEYHLIFNNNNDAEKIEQGDMVITLDQNWFIKVTATEASFLEIPNIKIYADNQTTWDEIALYAWGDGPELFGGWPGMVSTTTETVNGVEYLVYPAQANGLTYNLIFNNNNHEVQLGDFPITLNQDVYLEVTDSGVKFKE